MASAVDICNLGLAHLGSDAQVASIDPPDGSVEAGHCARFWPIVRAEVLAAGAWTFAKTRATLAAVPNTSASWLYAYGVPSNILNALRVLNGDAAALPIEWGGADFEIEGNVLFTNEPDAVLLYTQDVVDLSRYSAHCIATLGYMMAAYLAGPLIKGAEGARTGGTFRQAATGLMAKALALDANNSSEPAGTTSAAVQARA